MINLITIRIDCEMDETTLNDNILENIMILKQLVLKIIFY